MIICKLNPHIIRLSRRFSAEPVWLNILSTSRKEVLNQHQTISFASREFFHSLAQCTVECVVKQNCAHQNGIIIEIRLKIDGALNNATRYNPLQLAIE